MKIYGLAALLLLSAPTLAQVGNPFPAMEAETLTNEMVNIPEDLKGKYSIIGLAYTKKSEKYLKNWFEPMFNTFIYKPETPSVFASTYDVHCYFIPMFTGVKRAAYKSTMKKVEEGVDKRLHRNVLFYKGDLKTYKKALNFQGRDLPYIFILNPEGEILHVVPGSYTEGRMQTIVDLVQDAWQ